MECSFKIHFKKTKQIDDRTFNASIPHPKQNPTFFEEVTIRLYEDHELAKAVHRNASSFPHTSVARAKWVDIPSSGPARVFFCRFHKYSFKEWAKSLGKPVVWEDCRIRKTFKSIVDVIDSLHEHHLDNLDLKNSIRVDDDNNVQIVLDSMGTGQNAGTGIARDITDFKWLVHRLVNKNEAPSHSVGYRLFCRLDRHLSSRENALLLDNGWLGSYSYFLLHNPLFYDVNDRLHCMYQLLAIRAFNTKDFDRLMFPNSRQMKGITEWTAKVQMDRVLQTLYDKHKNRYGTEASILLFHEYCYEYGQTIDMGALELQKRLDDIFPEAIYYLFYFFVKRIESKKMFHGFSVMHYFKHLFG